MENKISEHRVLLERIPEVLDTKSAWLLLSFCAAARANFFLRGVNPNLAEQFAAAHDHGVWQCLCRISQISLSCGACNQSSLPLWGGGRFGLRSARRTQPAAHWASWANAPKMVKERHPAVADTNLRVLETNTESCSIQAVLRCTRNLHNAGFESLAWTELAEEHAPDLVEEEKDPCQPRFGWQKQTNSAIERHHHDVRVWPQLAESGAMVRSQRGPLANTPFVSFPVDTTSRFDPAPFLFAGFVCPFPSLFATAGVAVHWTPLATTVQLAQQRVCWGAGAGRCGQGVQRRRSQSSGECVRARHGPGRTQPVGWQAS